MASFRFGTQKPRSTLNLNLAHPRHATTNMALEKAMHQDQTLTQSEPQPNLWKSSFGPGAQERSTWGDKGLVIASANMKAASTTRFPVSMKRLQGCSDPAPDALTLANSTPAFGYELRRISGARPCAVGLGFVLYDGGSHVARYSSRP
jgi:hypothetical protein